MRLVLVNHFGVGTSYTKCGKALLYIGLSNLSTWLSYLSSTFSCGCM